MQRIDFPQVVNCEPFTEVEAYFIYGVTTAADDALSIKQAYWLVGAARICDWAPEGLAYAFALARRGGPKLLPFEATDEELGAEARSILDEGIAGHLRATGRLQ